MPAKDPRSSSGVQALFDQGVGHQNAGRLQEAEKLYRRVLELLPRNSAALYNLAMVEAGLDHGPQARLTLQRARDSGLDPVTGIFGEAEISRRLGQPLAAADCYRKILADDPGSAEALEGLAGVLCEAGSLAEAVTPALQLAELTDTADAHSNLGSLLQELGRTDEALVHLQKALEKAPLHAAAHNNLGNLLRHIGRISEARKSFLAAAKLGPHLVHPLHNLAELEAAQGHWQASLDLVMQALALGETPRTRFLAAQCLTAARLAGDAQIRGIMRRALVEPWARPDDLSSAAAYMVRAAGPFEHFADDADCDAIVSRLAEFSRDAVLLALLESAPVVDLVLEGHLTRSRAAILSAIAAEKALPPASMPFAAALARQCVVNEFVFCRTQEEERLVQALHAKIRDGNAAGAAIREDEILALACYLPLWELPQADLLVARAWSAPLRALIETTIGEWSREQTLRREIGLLTPVGSAHAQAVQRHYEQNPYPRWIRTIAMDREAGLGPAMRRMFPHAALQTLPEHGAIDILVAGCGTGQQVLELAMRFPQARIVAFDLSVASLAYARRKAEEAGVGNVQFFQGDIMELGALAQQFDLVVSTGVLVLVEDPAAACRLLAERVRPGGIMHIALYSRTARRPLEAVQTMAAAMGGLGSADAVRRLRARVMEVNTDGAFDVVLGTQDFYTVSGCRDMLSAVRENQFDLDMIARFLADNHFQFLGFQLPPDILEVYRRQNPADPAAIDIGAWQRFEAENPSTFISMYQIWAQRVEKGGG